MKIYHLGDAEVDAYLIDLLRNRFPAAIEAAGEHKLVLTYIGKSGKALMDRINQLSEDARKVLSQKKALMLRANFQRNSKTALFYRFKTDGADELLNDTDLIGLIHDAHVFLLDSSVHSGKTMRAVANQMVDAGATAITTYGLVVKANASFIPNFFGLMMGRDDRALFLLEEIPNNRIMPTGRLRLLEMQDMSKPAVTSNLHSMDRNSWSDMLYEMRTQPEKRQTFVYEGEDGKLLAYLSVQFIGQGVLFLDAIAVDNSKQKKRLGTHLIRWAETFARHNDCYAISLWAINNRVSWYEERDFVKISDEVLSLVENEKTEEYVHMQKTIALNRLGVLN